MEEIKEEIEDLKDLTKRLKNKVEYQQLEIDKLTKIINHVDMIRVCEILKDQY